MQIRSDMIVLFAARPDEAGAGYEFLQLRRAPDRFMGGTWQTVMGRLEAGETAWQAALRELKEETGLVPAEFYRLSVIESFYVHQDDTIWHCPCFAALVAPGAAVSLNAEHDAHRWLPQDQVLKQTMWPGQRQAIVEFFRDVLHGSEAKPHLRIEF